MINVPNSTEGIGLRYTFIAGSNTKVIVYNFDILSNIICNFLCDWVSTQFRAYPFERALFSALNRVSLIN